MNSFAISIIAFDNTHRDDVLRRLEEALTDYNAHCPEGRELGIGD